MCPGKGAAGVHVYLAGPVAEGHSGGMPVSDWESIRQLRSDALWKAADRVLVTRAMLRCGLAAGWVTLAGLTISGGAWIGGLPMLLTSGLSLLHASHGVVLRLEERMPRALRRLFERLFVYPDEPHVNWVGIAELLGLVSLGMATGWPLRLLAGDPATAAVGSAIVVGILGSFIANVAGHLVWEVDQDTPPRSGCTAWNVHRPVRRSRWAGAAVVGIADHTGPVRCRRRPGDGYGRFLAVDRTGRRPGQGIQPGAEQTTERAHRIDSVLVHSTLKNPSRAIIDELKLISHPGLRAGARRLCYSIGGFGQSLPSEECGICGMQARCCRRCCRSTRTGRSATRRASRMISSRRI